MKYKYNADLPAQTTKVVQSGGRIDANAANAVRIRLTEDKTSYFSGSELVIGIGKKTELSQRKWVLVARKVIALAKQNSIKSIAVDLKDFDLPAETLAVNFEMANYEFVNYKSKKEASFVEEIVLSGGTAQSGRTALERGQIIGEEVNASRTLANTPAGEMTPYKFAHAVREAVRGFAPKIKVTVLGKKEMQKLGMGAILGVAQGSSEEPQFVVMEYYNAPRPPLINKRGSKTPSPLFIRGIEGVIALIGKGITFDSGGLNLKPGDNMNDMHLDMSGGAAVAHAIIAAARLGIKKNIVGLIPAVENMPSGSSYRPGDVLKSMSGATIEIGNTDAEGRVVLADALTYAKKYNPRLVIDVATLTGAAQAALGQYASAIFCNNEELRLKIQQFGEESGDYVWPLPLWDEYEEDIKGTFGDWSNTGKTKWGGAIHGAVFLKQFAKDFKDWVHLDIAPRMVSVEGEYLAKGSAGAPVRLLVKAIEEL